MSANKRSKKSAKRVHKSSITGQEGVNLIERVVLGMGFLWYPTGGLEAGIDGLVEIRDPESGEVTNSVLQVQSKAGGSFFRSETEASFEFVCDERDLDYWLRGNAPVILVVSRPPDEAYWVSVKDYFSDASRRAARKVRFDKERDRFDEGSKEAFISLAVPEDAGLYFAPPPKQETLYSNLLRVSRFPEKVYVAQTDYRTGQEVRAKLDAMDAREEREWVAKSKSIMSFNDLSEWPWVEICDQGTVEAFDADEWADSEDFDVRGDFVQLLYRCLDAKARALGLRYDRDHRCHYFRATKKLGERQISYKSVANETKRTVFKRYVKKGNPDETAYYRHSAFEGRFKRFGGAWYLEITPTYHFTRDGWEASLYYEDNLTGIKQLETNQALLGQTVMWAEYLGGDDSLFGPAYPRLEFDGLETFELAAGIDEGEWLGRDEEGGAEEAPEGSSLFS